MFTRIRKIELEIQTLNENNLDIDHPSMFAFKSKSFFVFVLFNY
jgi:hypothetical protein